MIKIDISKILSDKIKEPFFVKIIQNDEFHFEKLREMFNLYKKFDVRTIKAQIESFLTNPPEPFNFQKLLDSQVNTTFSEFLLLIGKMISIFDAKGYNSAVWNPYNDKRSVSLSQTTQKIWTIVLFQYKLNGFTFNNLNKSIYNSAINSIKFIEDPENNVSISSENHRTQIRNYFKLNDVNEILSLFAKYSSNIKNNDNKAVLATHLLYTHEIKNLWIESIIGLMASDSTGWQDDVISKMGGKDFFIYWNSKLPSGTTDTLKSLRNHLNENHYFEIFWKSKNDIKYYAQAIDFATSDKELQQKKWNKNRQVHYYFNTFDEYKDNKKAAKILFLIQNFQAVNDLSVTHFEFYKYFKEPRQDNLSPIKSVNKDKLPKTIILQEKNMNNNFLNQILFGPPGTGKTYNAIPMALNIINGFTLKETYTKEEWIIIKQAFDDLKNSNQIEFITFHQSLCYEDFIEGIKPLKPDDDDKFLKYEIQSGIFKKACAYAGYLCYQNYLQSDKNNAAYSFDELYDGFLEHLQSKLDKKESIIFPTITGNETQVKGINSSGSIIARAKNSIARKSAPLTQEKFQKIYDAFKTPDEITSLNMIRKLGIGHRETEFYSVFCGLKEFEKGFIPSENELSAEIDSAEIIKKYEAGVFIDAIKNHLENAQNVVLIIDEINRGNVSSIFGELITLLEPAKRIGGKEHLKIKLPYSKTDFEVPPNLYIIGTMNTADRSVEALDTALRRRFSFKEMPPKPELLKDNEIKGIYLEGLLTRLNERIEMLLDKDHLIGHSYFMNIDSPHGLKMVFKNNIIPLLQEYFYGDYGKIGLVLGEGFFEKPLDFNDKVFSKFFDYNADNLDGKTVYRIKDIEKLSDDEFINALNLI
ncbi:MAG: AAA family ATPase [Bacteroidales bacterium]|nr:AAA family ATPase [Bacteroidales bacterium]